MHALLQLQTRRRPLHATVACAHLNVCHSINIMTDRQDNDKFLSSEYALHALTRHRDRGSFSLDTFYKCMETWVALSFTQTNTTPRPGTNKGRPGYCPRKRPRLSGNAPASAAPAQTRAAYTSTRSQPLTPREELPAPATGTRVPALQCNYSRTSDNNYLRHLTYYISDEFSMHKKD